MKTPAIALVALLCVLTLGFTAARAQDDLPEYGVLGELRHLRKVYVGADDPDSRDSLLYVLKKYKGLEIVNSPDEAEFFLLYQVKASTEDRGRQRSHYQRSTLTAYTMTPTKRKRVLWSENETWEQQNGLSFSAPNEINLAKHFVKELQRLRGNEK